MPSRNAPVNVSPEQLGAWITRWGGPLRAWLRGRCASPEDIVQEAFCRLAQQRRAPDRVSAWLFQVVANLMREEHRRADRESRRFQAVARPEARPCELDRQVEADELRQCIDGLPDDLREVLVARLWGDLTFQDISRLVGASVATVQRRYERSLILLRERLGEPSSQGR